MTQKRSKKLTKGHNRSHSLQAEKVFNDVYFEGEKMSDAMRKAGYSDSMVKNSHLVKRTDTWQRCLEKHGITDDYLSRKHKELIESDNENIKVKSIDMAYKVMGKYENRTGTTFNAPVQINIAPMKPPKSQ